MTFMIASIAGAYIPYKSAPLDSSRQPCHRGLLCCLTVSARALFRYPQIRKSRLKTEASLVIFPPNKMNVEFPAQSELDHVHDFLRVLFASISLAERLTAFWRR